MNIADQIAEFPLFPAWCDAQQSFACSSDVREDFADWRVIPIARHRDSAARQRSNYRVALADLERVALSTGGDVYEFRSSHWAVGWTEILLVRGEGVLTAAAEIVMALADYPATARASGSNTSAITRTNSSSARLLTCSVASVATILQDALAI